MRNPKQLSYLFLKNFTNLSAYRAIFSALMRDFLRMQENSFTKKETLRGALRWLVSMQNSDSGFATDFSLLFGRGENFPEITGYIIPTLLDAGNTDNASRAGQWLLKIQSYEGWFPSNTKPPQPLIFDSGQIIFGLLALYHKTKDNKFLAAVEKAGDWIINQQDPKGFWQKHAYNNIPHTYYAMVSWALLELWNVTKNDIYKNAAIKQLNWALTQQLENGFFQKASFFNDELPVLHTIAYTLQGLIFSGLIVNEQKYIKAAQKTADALIEINQREFPIRGYFNSKWKSPTQAICLTGLAQISIVFLKLYEITNSPIYLQEARKLNNYVRRQQIQNGPKILKGAIAGSKPIFGRYMPWSFPTWATKFFIDALMLENRYKNTHLTIAAFPVDSLKSYVRKGEMRKNYFNPGNLFKEIRIFERETNTYSEEEKKKLQFMMGDATFFIHHQKDFQNIAPSVIRAYGVFTEGYYAKRLAQQTGAPLLISLHGNYDLDNRYYVLRRGKILKYVKYALWKYLYERKILKRADKIMAVYQFAADYASKNGIIKEKITVNYNRVAPEIFYQDASLAKEKKFTLICVGRLIPEKNQETVMRAIADLDIHLFIVGNGPEKPRLHELAKSLGISQKITFIEKLDNKEMRTLYNKAHAYITANKYGGIEIPVIEAMACGLPIIRSKHPLEKEPELLGFENCVYADNTPESFRNAILKLLQDKNLYTNLIQKSLSIYQSINGNKTEENEQNIYINLL